MDPISGPTLVLEAWKVGGIVAALLAIIALIVYLGWKDSKSREADSQARELRMAEALDNCQSKHVEIAATTATALANNTNAMTELCNVMRDRPCLKDPTPTRPHSQIPDFRTPRPT